MTRADECRELLILRSRALETKIREAGGKIDERLVLKRWEELEIELPRRGASV